MAKLGPGDIAPNKQIVNKENQIVTVIIPFLVKPSVPT
jgi:hypothetical protein